MQCALRIGDGRPEHIGFSWLTLVFLHIANRGVAAITLRQLRGADADRQVVDVAVAVEGLAIEGCDLSWGVGGVVTDRFDAQVEVAEAHVHVSSAVVLVLFAELPCPEEFVGVRLDLLAIERTDRGDDELNAGFRLKIGEFGGEGLARIGWNDVGLIDDAARKRREIGGTNGDAGEASEPGFLVFGKDNEGPSL